MELVKKEKLSLFKRKPKKRKTPLKPPVFELLNVVVNRGRGEDVLDFLKSLKVKHNIITYGVGTASSSIANLLSLYNKEKEVIMAVIKIKDSKKILDKLESEILTSEKFMGIAFTVPLKSMTSHSVKSFN